ncbi:6-pyruvoyl trahydropterin synthase family protein [Halorubrum halodurans]|uniref:6-pyruvoyl trahydropterin synthase family protein n=1 Tax=Halorubrum halodurans TaxID=1383851 RepID=UPI001C529E6E|nr:6-carboxytetrahydropterin synthase [Halorubrum halodurans]
MYTVRVSRRFIAQHFLTVPDPGPEGELHSHRFEVDVAVAGPELNEHDYLVDIDELAGRVDELVDEYADATLNDRPRFEGYNPSVERFARVFCERLLEGIGTDGIETATVTMWEDEAAAASYETAVGE